MDCFIFDIDGVIVNLREKKVINIQLIDFIVKELERETPVIFITGRELNWLKSSVVNLITERVSDFSNKDNLFVAGEFGGDVLSFGGGKEIIQTEKISLPDNFVNEANILTSEFSDVMEWSIKKTLYTSSIKPNKDLERQYRPAQLKIAEKYEILLNKYKLKEFEVHKDYVAVNIRHKGIDKSFATKKAIKWIYEKKYRVEVFRAFGDSSSDLEIGEELKKQGVNFEFIFVGDSNTLPNNISFPVHVTEDKFEKGTLEYLSKLSV